MTRCKTTQPTADAQAPDEAVEGAPNDFKAIYQRIQATRAAVAPPSLEPEQALLPGVTVPKTPGDTAPLNNHLARTPLFSPIKRGRRKMLDKAPLVGPSGNRAAFYSGKQLDMADQDVYLLALQMASGVGPGEHITVHLGEFMRRLGRKSDGASGLAWLKTVFERISTGRLFFENEDDFVSIPLLGALHISKRSQVWGFDIPSETLHLFLGQSYGYVDMAKRRALARRVDLAKWVQGYAMSHDARYQHAVSLENLHKWSGYEGRMRDFRNYLAEALNELRRVGILTSWEFAERKKIVRWNR